MKALKYTFLIIILSTCIACGDDDDSNNESNPETEGNIIGWVNLYDESINRLSNEGMRVVVETTNSQISATTDQDGKFTLENVIFGNHTLRYEKEGYGTFKRFNIEHTTLSSPTIINNSPSLGQVSSTKITSVSSSLDSDNNVVLAIETSPNASIGNTRYIRIFLSSSSDVSSSNFEVASEGLIVQNTPYEETLSLEMLNKLGYIQDTTVYVRVYGDSFWSNSYIDPITNEHFYPNLNAETVPVYSFVVP